MPSLIFDTEYLIREFGFEVTAVYAEGIELSQITRWGNVDVLIVCKEPSEDSDEPVTLILDFPEDDDLSEVDINNQEAHTPGFLDRLSFFESVLEFCVIDDDLWYDDLLEELL